MAQTHNPHCDAVRAACAHPTSITEHDLACASRLIENAHAHLREAYRLLKPDNVLRIQAETAGASAKRLREAIQARGAGRAH